MTTSPSTQNSSPSSKVRIIGMAVVGTNEPYLKATLDNLKDLCDEVVICFNNATQQDVVAEYGFHTIEDNREWGKTQWLIKENLLKNHVAKLNPDWVIALDADEVFEKRFTREEAEKLASKGGIGYYFYLANLYGNGYSKEWSRWNIRMFKFSPEYGLDYQQKPVHCGLAPAVAYHFGNYAPFLVKHYGLKTKPARDKRIERYKKYDPDAKHLAPSYYAFLASQAKVDKFDEDTLHEEIANEVKDYHFKQPRHKTTKQKYFLVRSTDGRELDIPERNLDETLKRGFTLIRELD